MGNMCSSPYDLLTMLELGGQPASNAMVALNQLTTATSQYHPQGRIKLKSFKGRYLNRINCYRSNDGEAPQKVHRRPESKENVRRISDGAARQSVPEQPESGNGRGEITRDVAGVRGRDDEQFVGTGQSAVETARLARPIDDEQYE